MKKFFSILIFCHCAFFANATNHYFATAGSDGAAGTQVAPWQTTTKFNSTITSAAAGDTFFFNRGDVFYGMLNIGHSGSAGNPIVIAAYGMGAKPIITGLTTITSWTNTGGNIWQSTSAVTSLTTMNMVVINGTLQPMGRLPKATDANGGYLTFQSHSGNESITSSGISGSPYYVGGVGQFIGGEVVIRCKHWILDRERINSQSSTTIGYTNIVSQGGYYNPTDNYGFFFQNHVNACTTQGEWVYDSTSRKLSIYSSSSPTGVQVTTVDTLVNVTSKSYVTFRGLSFTGSNSKTFEFSAATYIIIDSCNLSLAGMDAMIVEGNHSLTTNNTITNCTINYVNNNALTLNNSTTWDIENNVITNVGMIAGMGQGGDGEYLGSLYIGQGSTVKNNDFGNIGYTVIWFSGSSINVQNNYVHDYCVVKDDGGGIYTYNNNDTLTTITGNIVTNGIGNYYGTDAGTYLEVEGIYMDDHSRNITISGNSVYNVGQRGIYIHNAHEIKILSNTSFNNNVQIAFLHDGISPTDSLRNITLKYNIFCAKKSTQEVFDFETPDNDIARSFTVSDSNYLTRPISESNSIVTYPTGGSPTDYSLAGWKTYSGLDAHSSTATVIISDTSKIRFEFNATSSNRTVGLGANYINVAGATYNGSITISPYNSAVLIYSSPLSILDLDSNQLRYSPPSLRFGFNNPVKDYLTVTIPSDASEMRQVQLFDMTGRQLLKKKILLQRGNNTVKIDVRNIANGIYLLQMTDEHGYPEHFKIVKLN